MALDRQGTEVAETVRVCSRCSVIEGVPPHTNSMPCTGPHLWIIVPLAEPAGAESHVLNPHPDGGWPEVLITHVYVIHSDDPAVIEAARRRLLTEANDAAF